MHPNVHCSTIYNNQERKQPKCPLTEKGIKKIPLHISNGLSLSRRKKWNGSLEEMWMELETAVQSEVSQKVAL